MRASLARLTVLLAALLLTTVYFFPLWKFELIAPQYPEGLRLQVWIDKIAGDVKNINVLNHYIGMSKIEPEKIPELRAFPIIFGVLSISGMALAIFNIRRLYPFWCAGVLVFALVGLYDFYSWEYRFGHDLSDDAPMKLEDSYQPPLIGTKQLLTITIKSYPDIAGIAFSASAGLATLSLLTFLLRRKQI